jgi:UDP-N-acetyl-D-mannosaminuronate dehydrogenase
MNGQRSLGLTCGFLTVLAVIGIGFCALTGAVVAAVGGGQTVGAAVDRSSVWVVEGEEYRPHITRPAVPTWVEDIVGRNVRSSGG